jgi:hypothetical protein
MGRLKRLSQLCAFLAFIPLEGHADASNYCMWMILVESHAIAVRCGKPLDERTEQRYRRLRQAAEEEIVRDASLSPGWTSGKAKLLIANFVAHGMLASARFPDYCSKPDAPMVLRMFEGITSAENTPKVLAGLQVRKNPFGGDCL